MLLQYRHNNNNTSTTTHPDIELPSSSLEHVTSLTTLSASTHHLLLLL